MYTFTMLSIWAALASSITFNAFSQGTAFTYQGRLSDGANPANGQYDLRFGVYDTVTNGNQQGNLITNTATPVSNGLFTVVLDFGDQFPGADRWLEISVRTNGGGAFATLSPRQQLTATPYAVQAGNAASAGSVAAGNITGTLTPAQLPSNVLTNGASSVNISGAFSGDGSGVTNVNLPTLNSFGAISWPGSFVLSSSPAVGNFPRSVAVADLNGDGNVDLACANLLDSSISVLTNNGSGGFVLSSTLTVGSDPYAVTAADVNGDGKMDLISTDGDSNTLRILTNNGTGGFALSSLLVVGNQPVHIVAVDVNRDGKVDLVSASADSTAHYPLTVLTNNGSGGFVLAWSTNLGFQASDLAAADVNGDTNMDLVAVNNNLSQLTILTNKGGGVFALSSTPTVGFGPTAVTAADVNGDGRVDLITAGFSGAVSVLTNSASGIFQLASTLAGGDLESVTAADVNGDGKVDLIAANYSGKNLAVWINNGNASFALGSSPAVGPSPHWLGAADVNGDGKVDLICASYMAPGSLSVLINTPEFTGNLAADTVTAANFNGNGAGMSNLNAATLTGAVPSASLTSVPAGSLTGTVADTRLSANVALLNANQTFTGSNIFLISGANPGLRVTDGGSGDINVQTLPGGNSGFQAINFNGFFDGAERRYNTNKTRWRMLVDQRSSADVMVFDVFNGTGILSAMTLTTSGNLTTAGTVNGASDRNAKEHFTEVDVQAVLDKVTTLPLTHWNYKADPNVKHLGPVAQDFYAAFGLGGDNKHISMVDADGVALAAIQGLNEKVDTRVQELQAENTALKVELSNLKKLVETMNQKLSEGAR